MHAPCVWQGLDHKKRLILQGKPQSRLWDAPREMGSCWDMEMGLQSCWPGPGVALEEVVGAAVLSCWASQPAGAAASSYPWEPQESTQHTTFFLTSY